jgi:hypothetical protein
MPWDKVRKIQSQADGNVGHCLMERTRKRIGKEKEGNRRRAD